MKEVPAGTAMVMYHIKSVITFGREAHAMYGTRFSLMEAAVPVQSACKPA